MPGACDLAEWNVPHAPHEHRSLLVGIDGGRGKGLAGLPVDTNLLQTERKRLKTLLPGHRRVTLKLRPTSGWNGLQRLYRFCFLSAWRSNPSWIRRSISSA